MIKGFSLKNMVLALAIGALIGTNWHISGLTALDMVGWISTLSVLAWIAIEAFECKMEEIKK